jgi:prepilin-type N-terminal cleavage/methylation domain-containing protein
VNRVPAPSRGFTLLEVMLALALASIVAISAYGLFEVMRRSEQRQFVRMGESDEVARTYRAMERAFRTIVMSDAAVPGDETEIQERMRAFERAVENDEPDPPLDDDEPEPRLILRPDPASPYLDVDVDGSRLRMKAQVFELAVRIPPISGAQPDSRIFEAAVLAASGDRGGGIQSRRERERLEDPSEGTATEEEEEAERDPPQIAPGVRGVFELIADGVDPFGALGPNAGLEGWKPRETAEQGWTLWWRELPPPPPHDEDEGAEILDENGQPVPQTDPNAPPRRSREELEAEQLLQLAAARRVPLLTGLRWLKWEVYRGKRFDIRTRATWQSELPAYVKVAFETVEGRRENWMFEVGWTKGPEPGSEMNRNSLPNRPPALEVGGPGNGGDRSGRERPRNQRGQRNRGRENDTEVDK